MAYWASIQAPSSHNTQHSHGYSWGVASGYDDRQCLMDKVATLEKSIKDMSQRLIAERHNAQQEMHREQERHQKLMQALSAERDAQADKAMAHERVIWSGLEKQLQVCPADVLLGAPVGVGEGPSDLLFGKLLGRVKGQVEAIPSTIHPAPVGRQRWRLGEIVDVEEAFRAVFGDRYSEKGIMSGLSGVAELLDMDMEDVKSLEEEMDKMTINTKWMRGLSNAVLLTRECARSAMEAGERIPVVPLFATKDQYGIEEDAGRNENLNQDEEDDCTPEMHDNASLDDNEGGRESPQMGSTLTLGSGKGGAGFCEFSLVSDRSVPLEDIMARVEYYKAVDEEVADMTAKYHYLEERRQHNLGAAKQEAEALKELLAQQESHLSEAQKNLEAATQSEHAMFTRLSEDYREKDGPELARLNEIKNTAQERAHKLMEKLRRTLDVRDAAAADAKQVRDSIIEHRKTVQARHQQDEAKATAMLSVHAGVMSVMRRLNEECIAARELAERTQTSALQVIAEAKQDRERERVKECEELRATIQDNLTGTQSFIMDLDLRLRRDQAGAFSKRFRPLMDETRRCLEDLKENVKLLRGALQVVGGREIEDNDDAGSVMTCASTGASGFDAIPLDQSE